MPFISRKKLDELKVSEFETRVANADLLQDLIGYRAALAARNNELDEVGSFLKYLATRVPDYEGYVLEYMEFQESSDA